MKHHPGIDFFLSLSKGQSREPFITVKKENVSDFKMPICIPWNKDKQKYFIQRMCKINEPNRKFKKKKKSFSLFPFFFLSSSSYFYPKFFFFLKMS